MPVNGGIKHQGCKVCKSKDQQVLKSVLLKGEVMGFALCDGCLKDARKKGTVTETNG